MRNIIGAAVGAALIVAAGIGSAVAMGTNGPPDKITICHVAGRADDPANYITLSLPPSAVYGPGGHFNENGTPQAGHEQDSFGPCEPPTETEPTDQCPDNPDRTEPPCEDEPPTTTGEEPPTTTTTPEPPRVCPDGGPPTPGEGAYDPNDDCARPPAPTTTTTVTETTPVPTVTETAPTTTTTEPPVVETSSAGPVSAPKPKPDKPPVVVKVEKKPNGVVKITTSDGKTHTGIMGSG